MQVMQVQASVLWWLLHRNLQPCETPESIALLQQGAHFLRLLIDCRLGRDDPAVLIMHGCILNDLRRSSTHMSICAPAAGAAGQVNKQYRLRLDDACSSCISGREL